VDKWQRGNEKGGEFLNSQKKGRGCAICRDTRKSRESLEARNGEQIKGESPAKMGRKNSNIRAVNKEERKKFTGVTLENVRKKGGVFVVLGRM